MPIKNHSRTALACVVAFALPACQTTPPATSLPAPPVSSGSRPSGSVSPALAEAAARATSPDGGDRTTIYKGSGVVVKGQQPAGTPPPSPPPVQVTGAGVVLNFEGADLREVVRNILGDILNESYTIDPAVGGQVTIRTSAGIPREALVATLETLLRMNGATMVKEGGIYKVVPQAAAIRGNVTPQLGTSQRQLPTGFSVQIVPLRHVGVRDMLRILEPFARDATAIRADDTRNLLILAGTELELRHMLDAVEMFDIDWMSGMSVGVFTLQNADVKSMMQELDKVIGDRNTSPLTGILRVIPIERMNAVIVISPNPAYVEEARKWIERLDSGSGEGVRFYVYNLQNTRAEHIAPLLQQAFTGRVTQQISTPAPTVAPGTPAGTIVNPPTFQAQPTSPFTSATPAAPTPPPAAAAIAAARAAGAGAGGEASGIARNVQVVGDKEQNTILIVATPSEYSLVEAALKKLDVQQRQVMIEVTIAEVTLSDTLVFGVEWLFKGGAPSGRGSGGFFAPNSGSTPFNPAVPIPTTAAGAAASAGLAIAQGFSYIINNANFPGGVQAVLNLLDTYGNTRVISNPHLAALDNQKATIKSGTRIPINQQSVVGSTTNVITTTSQYIDTGVLLQVTPHINAGGLVTLDVQAEVSIPGTPAVAGDAPPLNTRSVQTLVAVPSGRTMIMGGLIQSNKGNTTNGIPLLDRIPILGGLFGKQTVNDDRTELILFITPRVVSNELDYEGVINDLRRRMENLDRQFPGTSTWPASPPNPIDQLNQFFTPRIGPFTPPPPTVPAVPPPAGQPTQTPPPAPEPIPKP
ncbi:MAG TPA: type II secretion system secretin GspD [Casimicrobiaceae bacterium]|jgi:general secretion pathway protein D